MDECKPLPTRQAEPMANPLPMAAVVLPAVYRRKLKSNAKICKQFYHVVD